MIAERWLTVLGSPIASAIRAPRPPWQRKSQARITRPRMSPAPCAGAGSNLPAVRAHPIDVDKTSMDPPSRSSLLCWREIPATIWALGFVSLLMDLSSEMIHAVLPLYLITIMGASTLTVGIIEGIAEATASITKIFSGVLSDRLGKRKRLVAIGYGLAAV